MEGFQINNKNNEMLNIDRKVKNNIKNSMNVLILTEITISSKFPKR